MNFIWRAATDLGTVEVKAVSEAQAKCRARYKAVHQRFYGRPADLARKVKRCEVHSIKLVGQEA